MPPKTRTQKSSPNDDHLSDEGQAIIDLIELKLDVMKNEILQKIDEKDKKIDDLERKVHSLERQNGDLLMRLEDVEAEMRSNSLILSGDALPVTSKDEDVAGVVTAVIWDNLKTKISRDVISHARRIGKKPTATADKRKIIVRFQPGDTKDDLIRTCKRAKPNKLFMNEDLIPTRATILFTLRRAKRRFPEIVDGCGSHGGQVYVWVKPRNGDGRNQKTYVNNMAKLEDVCRKSLNISSSELISTNN